MKYSGKKDLNSFISFLEKNEIQMKASSSEEIEQLKQLVPNKYIPNNYLKFMEKCGNGFRVFKGSSYTMSEILDLKKWAVELLEEDNSSEVLSDYDFVFFMHQGYQFYFFRLDEGNDPRIYFYEEGEHSQKFVEKYDSFLDFLIEYYNDVEHLI
jgi:hypothetical protein